MSPSHRALPDHPAFPAGEGRLARGPPARHRPAPQARPDRPRDRPVPPPRAPRPFVVNTANNGTDLPGELVRSAGDPASGDPAVDEAYAGVEGTLALFKEVYDRSSYDGQGAQVVTTVHYDQDYDNAFWDGQQLVIGDGDGTVFERFTIAADVLGHELTHAVTQHTANLTYQGQSGALNESVSDVFGSLPQAAARGGDRRRGRLADRRGHLQARHPGHCAAVDEGARHGLRRPEAGQGPAGLLDGRLRRDHRRQRRRAHQLRHPQQGVLPRRERPGREQLGGRRRDLVRRAHLGSRPGHRLRRASRRRPSRRRRTSRRRPRPRSRRPGPASA